MQLDADHFVAKVNQIKLGHTGACSVTLKSDFFPKLDLLSALSFRSDQNGFVAATH